MDYQQSAFGGVPANPQSNTSQIQGHSELKREINEAFNMLDTGRKGYLNGKEMKVAFRAFGLKLPQKEIDEMAAENKSSRHSPSV